MAAAVDVPGAGAGVATGAGGDDPNPKSRRKLMSADESLLALGVYWGRAGVWYVAGNG